MSFYSQLLPCRHLAITDTKIRRTAAESLAKKLQMLWFNFIPGSNFLFFCFKLIIMLLSYITIPEKQKKRKFERRITLNHNTDISTETNSRYYGLTDTSLGPDTDINQHLSTFWQNYLRL